MEMVEDDDQAKHFRQRRYFFYLSGCKLPDSYLIYNIPQNHLTLFIPPIDPDSVIWAGLPESPEEALAKYDVDAVKLTNEVNPSLAAFGPSQSITLLPFASTNLDSLRTAIDECRVIKDTHEVALIRKANQISTLAHLAAQKAARTATNEQELYGAFIGTCISNGAHEQAYHSICASGTSCSTLHYIRNDKPLRSRLNILMDAGAEYECYCADITRTFALSGTFTPESQTIYDIVKGMQSSCYTMMRAGMRWEDVHANAHRVAIRGLLNCGILKGEENEIFEKRVSVAFFPHGLGHYLGMDTHDTGGHADYGDRDAMFRYLRVRGEVPAGAVVSTCPTCDYFPHLSLPCYKDNPLTSHRSQTNQASTSAPSFSTLSSRTQRRRNTSTSPCWISTGTSAA
jgi:Xaa-Pro dipeptidase